MEKKFLGPDGITKFLGNLYNVFSKVGHTHTKSQITDFPTIPTRVSQLDNDSGFVSTDNNTTYTLTKNGSTITLAGTDGSSMSIDDSDTIIAVDSVLSSSSTNPVQNKIINETINQLSSDIENHVQDIKHGGTGATTAAAARTALGAVNMVSTTVMLRAANWSNNSLTLSVSTQFTSGKVLLPSPAPESYIAYTEANVRCADQKAGLLLFVCDDEPAEDLVVNLVALT